jgi:hypothetical protein
MLPMSTHGHNTPPERADDGTWWFVMDSVRFGPFQTRKGALQARANLRDQDSACGNAASAPPAVDLVECVARHPASPPEEEEAICAGQFAQLWDHI